MEEKYTRQTDMECKIKDCYMEDMLIDVFGFDSYCYHIDLKGEHICDICPFLPLVNKLAEFEGNC